MAKSSNWQNNILTIDSWDGDLPTGDWTGPEPVPLFSSLDSIQDENERKIFFRNLTIHFQPNKAQNPLILAWVKSNVNEDMRWLFPGIDIDHPQFQKLFHALPAIHSISENEDSKFRSERPEVFEKDWDDRLDKVRLEFIKYLENIKCPYGFVTNNEAIDNGMLEMKDYKRPNIIGSHDTLPGITNPPKKLWKYLNFSKFTSFLQTQSIWFSRPQYFEDPHEFTMDEPSQKELFLWKLNSFAREYNRAVISGMTGFVESCKILIDGLPIANDGRIENGGIKLSECSSILLASIRKDVQQWQESFFISCWRYTAFDSISIWNQYASLDQGIALVADLDNLKKSLQTSGDIRLALVDYRNFNDDQISPMRMNPLTYKDIRFSTEEEARFYFRARPSEKVKGIPIPIKLDEAISEIHLSPNSNKHFKEMIEDLLKKYGIKIPLIESTLGKVPNKF